MTPVLTAPVPDTGAEPDPLTALRDDYADRWTIEPCTILGGDWLTATAGEYHLTAKGADRLRRCLEDYEAGRWWF